MRFDVHRFASLDSTNRCALEAARGGASEGLVVVADHQTAGRGRRGRSWLAAPGASLLVSVLLRPPPGTAAHAVTMAAGLAMREAVGRAAGFVPELKWPNDLVVAGRKLAGLLTESDVGAGGRVRAVVVGVGVNVDWPEFPAELAGIATSCSAEAGGPVAREELLDAFLDRLGDRYDHLGDAARAYRSSLGTLGRRVSVERPEGDVVGRAVDVGPAGELLVEVASGCIVEIHVGDVIHLRDE